VTVSSCPSIRRSSIEDGDEVSIADVDVVDPHDDIALRSPASAAGVPGDDLLDVGPLLDAEPLGDLGGHDVPWMPRKGAGRSRAR
jgi:hypothetical protein